MEATMRRISILLWILSLFFAVAAWPQAPGLAPPGNVNPRIRPFPRKPDFPQIPPLPQRIGSAIPPASVSPDVVWVQCPPDAQAQGALCGNLDVPLDRKHPNQAKITLYFELYTHSNPGPAESAILFNVGGPGATTTGYRLLALGVFGQNRDVHDLLLIDDRGRGLSGTIVCDDLQYGPGPLFQAVGECAAQLGNAASRYGTGDIAQDVEAVRAALGYDLIDYCGLSYGGEDVTAYATRFGKHLRSIVLDAPLGTPILNQARFAVDRYWIGDKPRMVSLDCQRSPTCSPDHPSPEAELGALIRSVRVDPVVGDGHDANGNLVHVRIDETGLLNYALSTGEILAAARSLWQGDAAPLLRLGAEGYWTLGPVGNSGDPTVFSFGAQVAAWCSDKHQPFDWRDPLSERKEQWKEAISDLPRWYFAPFSKTAATSMLSVLPEWLCAYWEEPTPSSPVAPPHPTYPQAPTLVFSGDLDGTAPPAEVSNIATLFPNSTLVSVAGAGHTTFDSGSSCTPNLASQFIETLQVGDTTCTKTPWLVSPVVGRFPLLAKDARPAEVDPNGQNQIGLAERKVVTVAVATAIDALNRSTMGSGNGVGLRAGSFQTTLDANGNPTVMLTNCSFSEDVTVNGTVTWNTSSGALVADLIVAGSGTAGGNLHVEGTWGVSGPVGNFNVSGTLGGKQVAVLVPEA
jgi:pimeloyl-ACP methyl ester carboxylesterase